MSHHFGVIERDLALNGYGKRGAAILRLLDRTFGDDVADSRVGFYKLDRVSSDNGNGTAFHLSWVEVEVDHGQSTQYGLATGTVVSAEGKLKAVKVYHDLHLSKTRDNGEDEYG